MNQEALALEAVAAAAGADTLRLLTCGSVDDGKSTLIGRLLFDSHLLMEDQLADLEADSVKHGTAGEQIDFALLVDGLEAEREQGITIDVAYRFFATPKRRFIVADTPGHVQYTRNMATGASTADLAILLVDAAKGLTTQTRRHAAIVSLLGIRDVVLAVNKMDLVDWDRSRFEEICSEYLDFTKGLDLVDPYFLPISALVGDNVVEASERAPWFDGPPLMQHIETVDVEAGVDVDHLRLPVQMVLRPDLHFRGFAGTISSGVVRPGDEIVSLPSGVRSTVERIVTFDGDLDVAGPGRAVTVTLTDEIDVSRGDLLVSGGERPARAHDVDAMLVWMSDVELEPGKQYVMQTAAGLSNASVTAIRHRVDINTLDEEQAGSLGLNEIGRCALSADRELLFDPYDQNRETGSFILVDRLTNATVAAGMIVGASSSWDRAPQSSLTRHASEITPGERAVRFGQRPVTVLLTGLTAAGKTTIATALERRLFDRGKATIRLDGENVRMGISRDLGFSAQERSENLRRVAEIARLVNDQGIIAIAALVAPKDEVRRQARELVGEDRYVEVFVDTPLDVCRERDPHALYEAADRGDIPQFPGVSATYDRPDDADLRVDTSVHGVDECVEAILELLDVRGYLRGLNVDHG